jgi:hypothetical protein
MYADNRSADASVFDFVFCFCYFVVVAVVVCCLLQQQTALHKRTCTYTLHALCVYYMFVCMYVCVCVCVCVFVACIYGCGCVVAHYSPPCCDRLRCGVRLLAIMAQRSASTVVDGERGTEVDGERGMDADEGERGSAAKDAVESAGWPGWVAGMGKACPSGIGDCAADAAGVAAAGHNACGCGCSFNGEAEADW